ncbi:MAG: ATP-dependent DNA ligase [Ignavibacteriaceae bacterium]
MKYFAELNQRLDEAYKTDEKIDLLVEYFDSTNPDDSIWAIYLLVGKRIKQIIPVKKLKEWSLELAKIPDWLLGESFKVAGDLVETITLLLPKSSNSTKKSLHYWIEEKLLTLNNKEDNFQREEIIAAWNDMNTKERFVWNKLITGSFRTGVSSKLVIKALSIYSGINEPVIAYRLMGNWKPDGNLFKQIISTDSIDSGFCKPYPFYLPNQLDNDVENLGDIKGWQAEWKWSGIRAQIIKRDGKILIWSQEEEMLNEKFPEFESFRFLITDGTVIEGNLIAWQNEKPLPLGELQKRIRKKSITKKIIKDIPVVLMAYDLLELNGKDIRDEPLNIRSKKLIELINNISCRKLFFSYKINANTWEELKVKRNESRSRFVEGLMLKRINSPYREERKKCDWWKWKMEPLIIDVVLINARKGEGQNANLYTDYTFGVWDGNRLVPIAKACSGLTAEEIYKIDLFVRENSIEKFGPVCTVKPELVFELAFEGIQKSTRHKSGVVFRLPIINKWRHDKTMKDVYNLSDIKTFLS